MRSSSSLVSVGTPPRSALRHRLETETERQPRSREDPALRIEHDSLGQRADAGLCIDELLQPPGIGEQNRPLAIEVVRHCQNVPHDHLLMFGEVGFGNGDRFI